MCGEYEGEAQQQKKKEKKCNGERKGGKTELLKCMTEISSIFTCRLLAVLGAYIICNDRLNIIMHTSTN